jgi:transcriptional repressor NrdR
MLCPFCGYEETKVTDKRDSEKTSRRRRECLKCERRFTTYERPEVDITIIKKDKTRQEFDRDKLRSGFIKACEKRPVSKEDINSSIEKIEEYLLRKGGEVTSHMIGELVMKHLKKLDKVAYIRFASVYKEFKDIADFKTEIKEL